MGGEFEESIKCESTQPQPKAREAMARNIKISGGDI